MLPAIFHFSTWSSFRGQLYKEQFAQLTRQAFAQLVNDQINERLKSALVKVSTPEGVAASDAPLPVSPTKAAASNGNGAAEDGTLVETTGTELEAFYIVRAILREIVNVKRISMRDVQSYCGLLLDDNNRKPICRLHFNRTQKYLGLFVDEKEERVAINEVDDIYKYADRLKQTVQKYLDAEGAKKSKKTA